MQFAKLFALPWWGLFLLAVYLQIDTFFHSAVQNRKKGFVGALEVPAIITSRLLLGALGYLRYGWRATVFFSFHAWFRRIDDTVDAPGISDHHQYLGKKWTAIHCLTKEHHRDWKADFEDVLMVYAIREGYAHGLDLVPSFKNLFSVVVMDAEMGRKGFPSYRALYEVACRQDEYILRPLVKIFGGNEVRLSAFLKKSMGIFTRIDWIADLSQDLARGVIRISSEDAEVYGLTFGDCMGTSSGPHANKRWIALYMGYVHELEREWEYVREDLGENFGGIFHSRVTGYLFDRCMVRRFERTLEELTPANRCVRV